MAEERAAELAGLDEEGLPIASEDFSGFDENTAAQLRRQIITAPLKGPGGVAGTIRVSMNWGEAFFLSWSLLDITMVCLLGYYDGGVTSPAMLSLFLTLVFAALSYPLASMITAICSR
jgi:hypothetical protein